MKKLKLILTAVILLVLKTGLKTNEMNSKTYLSAHVENQRLTKRNEHHTQSGIQLITDRLDHLINYVKLFVHGNHFDIFGFELVESQLWETLDDTRYSMRLEASRLKALTN